MTAPASGLSGQLGMVEETWTNAVQTLTMTGTPTGGTFTLTYDGQTTAAIAYNASAANVATALQALPNIGATGCTTAGGSLPGTPVTVTFTAGKGGRAINLMTASSAALTGGSSPTMTPTTTTAGQGYGSGGTVSRFLPLKATDSIHQSIQDIESEAMIAGNVVLRSNAWALNRKGASGDVEFEFTPIGCGILLKHMLGAAPTIATPTNGVLTRTQTFTGPQDPTGISLCFQKGVPSERGVVTPFTFVGGKITSWELSNSTDQFLQLKTTLDFQDVNTSTALAAASYPTNVQKSLLTFVGGSLNVAGLPVPVKTWSLQCDHNLNTSRYFVKNTALKEEPIRSAYAQITGSFECDFKDLTLYNQWAAGTVDSTLTLAYSGQTIESVTPTYSYGLTVTLANVRLDGADPALSTMDIIPQTVPFKVLYDGTTPPITAVVTTTDTAI